MHKLNNVLGLELMNYFKSKEPNLAAIELNRYASKTLGQINLETLARKAVSALIVGGAVEGIFNQPWIKDWYLQATTKPEMERRRDAGLFEWPNSN